MNGQQINSNIGFEIDFLAVGEGERSGDAIALRFGNLSNPDGQRVVVIDGGTKDAGEALVNHIQNYYKANKVDLIVSTHPDSDHISGLAVVLEKLKVDNLLMHRPWEHAENIKSLFKRPVSVSGLEEKLEKGLQQANTLESLALEKNIPIYEPFTGLTAFNGFIHVLGPSQPYYEKLLSNFRTTPEPKQELGILERLKKVGEEAITWIAESLDHETLDDTSEHFSAENSSSTILLLTIGGEKILFTGDADIEALTLAADYAIQNGIDLSKLHLLDVPHHGSKHNVGPTILNRIKASKSQVSASKEDPKHPSKKVSNALFRRGSAVFTTEGKGICHPFNALPRVGWGPVSPLPFYDRVEE